MSPEVAAAVLGSKQHKFIMSDHKLGAEALERKLKKKLQTFLGEMLNFGSVKGFRYFATYLRGKEEMLISVINEANEADPSSPLNTSFNFSGQLSPSLNASFNSGNLPYDKQNLFLSGRTQMNLSGYGEIGVGLPPASPSERESNFEDCYTTLLLAGYGKYTCPYVWVRSNHSRLAKFTGNCDKDKDNPLKLKSINKWKDSDIGVWDVVAEVVKLCAFPPPRNPFAIDMSYFDNLDLKNKLVATGAMVHALQKIVFSQKEDVYYTAKVLEDIQKLTKVHFEVVKELSLQNQLPCLEKYKKDFQQKQQQAAQQQRRRRLSSGRQYPPEAFTQMSGYSHPFYYKN